MKGTLGPMTSDDLSLAREIFIRAMVSIVSEGVSVGSDNYREYVGSCCKSEFIARASFGVAKRFAEMQAEINACNLSEDTCPHCKRGAVEKKPSRSRDIMDDGGPWFPQTNDAWISTGTNPPVPCGASARQVLAKSAMEVLLTGYSKVLSAEQLAERAFLIADAMLAEGAKQDPTESKGG